MKRFASILLAMALLFSLTADASASWITLGLAKSMAERNLLKSDESIGYFTKQPHSATVQAGDTVRFRVDGVNFDAGPFWMLWDPETDKIYDADELHKYFDNVVVLRDLLLSLGDNCLTLMDVPVELDGFHVFAMYSKTIPDCSDESYYYSDEAILTVVQKPQTDWSSVFQAAASTQKQQIEPERVECYKCHGCKRCHYCGGFGNIPKYNGFGTETCQICWGSGQCQVCYGKGYLLN